MEKSFEIRVLSGIQSGAKATLPAGRATIGSADDCDIVLSADDVTGHHAALVLDGQSLTLTPLEGEVIRQDGTLIADPIPLEPHVPFGLGATILAVGPAATPWPRIDISRFGRRPDPAPHAAEPRPDTTAHPAEIPQTRQPDQPSPPQSNGPRPLATRIGGLTLYPLAALLLAGIGFIGFSWFTDGGAATGGATVEAAPAPIRPAASDRVTTALTEAGIRTNALDVRQIAENSVLVTGYVELSSQEASLRTVAAALDTDVVSRVWAMDTLVAQAQKRLSELAPGLSVAPVEPGVVAVTGYLADEPRRTRILAAVREDVPGLRTVVDRLTGPRDLADLLTVAIAASPLAGTVAVDPLGDDGVVVRGALGQDGLETWNAVLAGLEADLGTALPVRTAFVPVAGDLPFTIRGVVAGPMRYVMTGDGKRVGEGGTLGGGFMVERIADGEVTINGHGQTFVQRLKE
jgi:type III secretion system YscD/HrpQ family protein